MCGLAGFLDARHGLDPGLYEAVAAGMAERLAHRGPDGRGTWTDPAAGLGLGFRRLAILDRSAAGHQPMPSSCGRFVLAFNGEIYNHTALRRELGRGAAPWRGHGDSEVLLAAVARWGFVQALHRLDGMFAIALWDRHERRLWLARDRMGEKPLYYGKVGGTVLFASELKALSAHPVWSGLIDPAVIPLFLRYAYVPSPWSIFAGIRKLPAGHYLSIDSTGEIAAAQAYWSSWNEAAAAGARPFAGDIAAAADRLQALIDASVARRMTADVEVGAFLSGGVDSSVVVAAMQKARPGRVRTFAIGFPGSPGDESVHAEAVARHLGTTHTTLPVGARECLRVVPDLPLIYDEPFADSSQIPTALLCAMTRPHATVALSGDGGDELFNGYPRFASVASTWARTAHASPLRRRLACGLAMIGPAWGSFGHRLQKRAERHRHGTLEAFYASHMSRWRDHDRLTRPARLPRTLFDEPAPGAASVEQSLMLIDAATYLPDGLLVKVDRASMAVGLEVRAPFLDHELARFAWSLPPALAVAPGAKRVLLEGLYERVPRALVDRPKQGFAPPIGDWLNDGLRSWAEDLLSPVRLRRRGLVAADVVARRWQEHRSGRRDWGHALWSVLMLEAWLDHAAGAMAAPVEVRGPLPAAPAPVPG